MSHRCEEVGEALWAQATGAALPASVPPHLDECAACRDLAAEVTSTLALLAEERERPVPAEVVARLRRELAPVMDAAAAARAAPWWRRPLVLLAPAAATVALGIGMAVWITPDGTGPVGQIALRSGQVALQQPTPDGDRIVAGSRLTVGPRARLELELGADRLALEPETTLAVRELTLHHTRLELERGAVVVEVRRGEDERHVVVATPFGEVVVTGTLFRVASTDGGAVQTVRGSVAVKSTRAEAATRVTAGQRFTAESGEVAPLDATTRARVGATFVRPWYPASALATAVLVITGEPADADVMVDGQPLGPAPTRVRLPAGRHRYRVAAGDDTTEGEIELVAGQTAAVAYALAVGAADQGAASSPRTPRVAVARTVGGFDEALRAGKCQRAAAQLRSQTGLADRDAAERWALVAECAMGAKDPAEALTVYEMIASRYAGTATAPNALFEVGRLALRLQRDATARAAFADYVKKYPRGPLVDEAQFHLCALTLSAGALEKALGCLQAYRRNYPTAARTSEATLLEGKLHKDVRHDCTTAARLFGRYLDSGRSEERERAAYWRVECLRGLGAATFPEAARRYLEEFPLGAGAAEVKTWIQP